MEEDKKKFMEQMVNAGVIASNTNFNEFERLVDKADNDLRIAKKAFYKGSLLHNLKSIGLMFSLGIGAGIFAMTIGLEQGGATAMIAISSLIVTFSYAIPGQLKITRELQDKATSIQMDIINGLNKINGSSL